MGDLAGKRAVVVGFGASGLGAARLLLREGAQVTVSDRRPEIGPERAGLSGAVDWALGEHPREIFEAADLIVLSPGVPTDSAFLLPARTRGCPVIGELELASRYIAAPVIAITGSNGKSTTTALVGRILETVGGRVFTGGNLGPPLSHAALEGDWDWVVAEVSSFQLETIVRFRPRIAALLNVSPNHLDRYSSMEEYVQAKWRIFQNQGPAETAVLPEGFLPGERPLAARVVRFGLAPAPAPGTYLSNRRLVATFPSEIDLMDRDAIRLPGEHNLKNVLAAAAVALAAGAPPEAIRSAAAGFDGLPHRLERVRERAGVLFVNDSKATTVASMACALESLDRPVVLIAGGRDKGGDFAPLAPLVRRRVQHLVLLGEARAKLARQLGAGVPTTAAESLAAAVATAAAVARPGDVVLLSPGCSSYDMFVDFTDRGRQFKQLVQALP